MKNIINKLKTNIGLTLVELIVAMAILMLISGPIMYMFYQSQSDYAAQSKKIQIQDNIDRAMRGIVTDLRKVPMGTGKLVSDAKVDCILPIPGIDAATDISTDYIIMRYAGTTDNIITNSIGYKYNSLNKRLYRYTANSSLDYTQLSSATAVEKSILGEVSSFIITVNSKGIYKIQITVTPTNTKLVAPVTVSTSFKPRFDN